MVSLDNRLKINQPIHLIRNTTQNKGQIKDKSKESVLFKDILNKNIANNSAVKFSKHAQNRLVSRDIRVSDQDLDQLANGVQKAKEKGAKDSLIMVNNVAYVVSVTNKTVITAVDNGSMDEKIFTNIDSALFMD